MRLIVEKTGLLIALSVLVIFRGAYGKSAFPPRKYHSAPGPASTPACTGQGSITSPGIEATPTVCRPPHPPEPLTGMIVSYSARLDTTPPSPPRNVTIYRESIHSYFGRWEEAEDPESGISYYAFAIGTEPGEADLHWWQSTGLYLSSYSKSMSGWYRNILAEI